MRIDRVRTGILRAPLRNAFRTALRRVDEIRDVVVMVECDGGVGYGEAPPLAAITGETLSGIREAVEIISRAIVGRDVADLDDVEAAISRAIVHNGAAKAAVDMAVWDLFGQLHGAPVYRLLGGSRTTLETDITISVDDPQIMADRASEAIERGFDCLKVKVGIDPSLDAARLIAVRDAVGRRVKLRIDANQAWRPREAVRILNDIADQGVEVELVEQPVAAADIDGMKYVVKHSPVPVLADESAFSPADAMRVLRERAADMINIKLMKCGGIGAAIKIATAAEIYGVECMMGCMLETKLAVNAAVHVACAKRIITRIDLDGPLLCQEDPVKGGARFDGKEITVSDSPGLGIEGIDPKYIEMLD